MKSGRSFRGIPCLATALLIGAVGPALPASPSSLSAQDVRGMELTMADVPLQMRAYTCRFMAEVAAGERDMRNSVNYRNLIAGPGGE